MWFITLCVEMAIAIYLMIMVYRLITAVEAIARDVSRIAGRPQ